MKLQFIQSFDYCLNYYFVYWWFECCNRGKEIHMYHNIGFCANWYNGLFSPKCNVILSKSITNDNENKDIEAKGHKKVNTIDNYKSEKDKEVNGGKINYGQLHEIIKQVLWYRGRDIHIWCKLISVLFLVKKNDHLQNINIK